MKIILDEMNRNPTIIHIKDLSRLNANVVKSYRNVPFCDECNFLRR